MRLARLVLLASLILPASGVVHAQDASVIDPVLQKVIRVFDVRPLPTKDFEETSKFQLGRSLFFDPILSGNRDASCSTCHLIDRGTSDGAQFSSGTGASGLGPNRKLAEGRPQQPRNSLDLWNRDNNSVRSMFWDGRIEVIDPARRIFRSPLGNLLPSGFENIMAVQAVFPLVRADEMLGLPGDRSDRSLPDPHADRPNELALNPESLDAPSHISAVHNGIILRLLGPQFGSEHEWQEQYRRMFAEAFPNSTFDDYSIVQVGNALAHFIEIAFATRSTPWDDYVSGNQDAISLEAKRGALIFFGKGKCAVCHNGPLFSDFNFHSIGVKNHGPGIRGNGKDLGRYLQTEKEADKYRFRTPPLRNVTLTAPYFHNGSSPSLQDVINQHLNPLRFADQYKQSGEFLMDLEQIESVSGVLLPPPILSDLEITHLIEYLKSLEDVSSLDDPRIVPNSVPSGLPVVSRSDR
jgi:cytochrome c peroxidase